jgi:aryl-phospho-beta-D-glucosidase BglC (GH1 family)
MGSGLPALMLSVVVSTTAGVLASDDARDYIRVEGQRLVTGHGREFHIRGMGTGSTSSDPLEKDYEEIARLNFNAVTVFLSYNRLNNPAEPEKYNGPGWERVDKHVALARKYGLRVVLQMLGVEGGQFVPIKS